MSRDASWTDLHHFLSCGECFMRACVAMQEDTLAWQVAAVLSPYHRALELLCPADASPSPGPDALPPARVPHTREG